METKQSFRMPSKPISTKCFLISKSRRNKTLDSETAEEESVRLNDVTVGPNLWRDDVTRGNPHLRKRRSGLLYCGLLLILVASLLLACNPLDAVVRWQAAFREGSLIFGLWQQAPVKVSIMFYIFNYTNTEAFLRGEDERLHIEEIGPYVYDETVVFHNVTFNGNNTFTYVPIRTPKDDPANTVGDPKNDVIIVPNLALLGMSSYLADASFFTNMGFNLFAKFVDSKPFLNMTVDDFLWGYDEPLLKYASKIMPKAMPISKIGYLTMLCDEGLNVATINLNRENEIREDGRPIGGLTIDKYNGSPGLRHYGYVDDDNTTHSHCNTLQGIASEGIVLPRKGGVTERVAIYRKYFCRPIPIRWANYTHTSMGIPAYYFNTTNDAFHNSIPENSCFCNEELGPCLPDGLTDVSSCFFDIPVAISAPHYLFGDPKLADAWDNINPDAEKHNSYALVDRELGVMMKGHMRMQANLVMKNIRYNPKVEALKNRVLPMFWVDYFLNDIPQYLHILMYVALVVAPIFNNVVVATMFLIGTTMVIVFAKRRCQN